VEIDKNLFNIAKTTDKNKKPVRQKDEGQVTKSEKDSAPKSKKVPPTSTRKPMLPPAKAPEQKPVPKPIPKPAKPESFPNIGRPISASTPVVSKAAEVRKDAERRRSERNISPKKKVSETTKLRNVRRRGAVAASSQKSVSFYDLVSISVHFWYCCCC